VQVEAVKAATAAEYVAWIADRQCQLGAAARVAAVVPQLFEELTIDILFRCGLMRDSFGLPIRNDILPGAAIIAVVALDTLREPHRSRCTTRT